MNPFIEVQGDQIFLNLILSKALLGLLDNDLRLEIDFKKILVLKSNLSESPAQPEGQPNPAPKVGNLTTLIFLHIQK